MYRGKYGDPSFMVWYDDEEEEAFETKTLTLVPSPPVYSGQGPYNHFSTVTVPDAPESWNAAGPICQTVPAGGVNAVYFVPLFEAIVLVTWTVAGIGPEEEVLLVILPIKSTTSRAE